MASPIVLAWGNPERFRVLSSRLLLDRRLSVSGDHPFFGYVSEHCALHWCMERNLNNNLMKYKYCKIHILTESSRYSISSVETVFGHTRNRGCGIAAFCGRRAAANELCVSRPRSHACFLL